jgi:hypothetical protein
MEEFFVRVWVNLVGRLHGPLQFRLVLQPLMASLLAIRAGRKDAREGRLPYVWALVFDPGNRQANLRSGRRDVGSVFVVALIIDVLYQLLVQKWVYPGEAVIVALLLADLPYVVVRALTNRVARRLSMRRDPPRTR